MNTKLFAVVGIFSIGLVGAAQAQLTLSAGESYTYSFDSLPYFGDVNGAYPPTGINFATFSTVAGSQDPGDAYLLEIFENSTSETPLAMNTGAGTVTAQATGGWHDLQGFARVTVTSGTLTFDNLQVGVYRPTGAPSEYEFYNSGVVQVPEPSTLALWGCALAGMFIGLRRFKGRRAS
jgi:hypothetical protein